MRFLVALASIVLGLALAAGFIYRDGPVAKIASVKSVPVAPPASTQTGALATPSAAKPAPKIVAPKLVAEIASEQPTVLNADRSRFESATSAPAPELVTQNEGHRARRILVMALQGELRRVGCYSGAVDGKWTTNAKAAMFWFLKRVNAKIPVSKPDEAHLNLLKSADKDFCAEKKITPAFVTTVQPQDPVADGIPNPTSTINSTAFSDARQRAGLPPASRIASNGDPSTATEVDLPEPMAVGRVETRQKRRRYRARSRRVETLFKHPLGRF